MFKSALYILFKSLDSIGFTLGRSFYLGATMVCFFSFQGLSQSNTMGNFEMETYTKADIQGGTQNWDIEQLPSGHLLFANNNGLLVFDGISWTTFPLPNKTIARSIAYNQKDRIYIGGQDELGYFAFDASQQLKYTSLRALIPPPFLPLEDVWNMVWHNEKLYLRSLNRLYVYDEKQHSFRVTDPKSTLLSLFEFQGTVYYADQQRGIVQATDTTKLLQGSTFFKGMAVIGCFDIQGQTMVLTVDHGLFTFNSGKFQPAAAAINTYLRKYKAAAYCRLVGNKVAIGTYLGGVLLIDETVSYNKIDKESGLVNVGGLSLFKDHDGDLWVATTNGINKIRLTSSYLTLQPDGIEGASYYDVKLYKDKYYFASNNGLYVSQSPNKTIKPYTDSKYYLIEGSLGQTWGLNIVDNDLLLGHNDGPFIIKDNKAIPLSDKPGAWIFLPTSTKGDMYVGTYTGVDIYRKSQGQWKFYKKIHQFNESARMIISVKANELWVSHPYRGVYKIVHDEDYNTRSVQLYDAEKGLPSTLLNYIFDIDGIPTVTAKTGIYRYEASKDSFQYQENWSKTIGEAYNIRRLVPNGSKELWFIAEHEIGKLENRHATVLQKTLYPELKGKFVGGFERLYMGDSQRAFACSDIGLYILNLQKRQQLPLPKVSLNAVLLSKKDSFLYHAFHQLSPNVAQPITLHYTDNALRFEFGHLSHTNGISYSYRLLGLDTTWSNESSVNYKEFNNLPPKTYKFEVRAKRIGQAEGPITGYSFTITPPWYLLIWVQLLFVGLVLLFLLGLILIPNKKYKKEKAILTVAKEASDAKLYQVEKEKLEADIQFKNAELASTTMHLVQKNETLQKIREEIENVKKKVKDPDAKTELKKVLSVLSDDEFLEEDWENFSYHFDQVHTDFIKRISKAYPQLTPKDQKLCAYLRLNLNTKEIAPLMNISVRGVEISRYRLRKKMDLPSDENLNGFMMGF